MNIIICILALLILGIDIYRIYIDRKPKPIEKVEKPKLTKEQKKKQEELRKNFENLMGYGYEDALKKKE